ncbi:hypothetical protein ACXDF8_08880 [Mycolicibacterium sp. CBM1]
MLSAVKVSIAVLAGALAAPAAVAGAATEFDQAVAVARSASSCGPLRHNDTVAHAADVVNRSTQAYLSHSSFDIPADDTHPRAILKDLGIQTDKAIALQGAGHTAADAIKGALLEGYRAIPDCAYTAIGTSLLVEEQTGYVLVVAILVGS